MSQKAPLGRFNFWIAGGLLLPAIALTVAAIPRGQTEAAAAGRLRWKSGAIATSRQDAGAVVQTIEAGLSAGRSHFVAQFTQPMTEALRGQLQASGINLGAYLSDNAFFVSVVPGQFNGQGLRHVGTLIGVWDIDRTWKLDPAILGANIERHWIVEEDKGADPAKLAGPQGETDAAPAKFDDTEPGRRGNPDGSLGQDGQNNGVRPYNPVVAVILMLHRDVERSTGLAVVPRHGGTIINELRGINGAVVHIPFVNISALADEDVVQWIEPPLPKFEPWNLETRAMTGADIVHAPPYGLDGTGVTVFVYDVGGASHPDLAGRAQTIDGSAVSLHPTHVSGTVGGNGSASGGLQKGMAPNVSILNADFEWTGGDSFLYMNPGDMETDYPNAINNFGADIANNSIGNNTESNGFDCARQGNYGATDVIIDNLVRGFYSNDGSPFRIVWANGNERQGSRCNVEGFGAYYSIAPPAGAKNHMTVGAMNSNDDSVTSFTSWGPTDDGRMKPDVSAPGCQSNGDFGTTSCNTSGGYTALCGTSMASPTVCGLSALLLQDYRAHYPGDPDPRNSTLRCIWAHTAQDIGNFGPDYQTGFGSVRAEPAVQLVRSGNFLENAVSQSQVFRAVVIVGPSDTDLKVTLAWDDPPGTPNVDPALVNDLDLHVYTPGGGRLWPWGLNPSNPSAPADRGFEDHANNIEQVYWETVTPGAYTIEVHGYNVPEGPQPFSLTATPTLVNCSSQGIISLDRAKYACTSTASIRVIDCDLNTDDSTIQTVNINIASTTEPGGETVLLTETDPASSAFLGSINLRTTNSPGVLHISSGDAVTATYIDADDGQGGQNVPVTANATVDCTPPVITNVSVTVNGPRQATVTFTTDENAAGTVRYGSSCGSLGSSESGSGFVTNHSIVLSGLNENSTYYFAVDAQDEAANAATDDNGGSCYSFATPDIPNFFTEEFGGDHDLDNTLITFTPASNFDQYTACADTISALPVDPAGGTPLSLSDDDFETVTLGGGMTVPLYGVSYGSFHTGSNGYLTFSSGDTDYTESLAEHFAQPRISALYDDLYPPAGGQVSWKQFAGGVAVTWLNIQEYPGGTGPNTVQIVMYTDGRIQIASLSVTSPDSICGLSAGGGISPDFFESDLSQSGDCCSSAGTMNLTASLYSCTSTATMRVTDCDLNTDDGSIQTVNVNIASTNEPAGETVVLTETEPDSATFEGSIQLSSTNAPGVLHVTNGANITATYIDADDGDGGQNIPRTDTATADCVGPIITNVQVSNVTPQSATVTFDTNEAAEGTVRFGTSCGALNSSQTGQAGQTSHSITLSVTEDTTYYFAVDAEDVAGNTTTNNNGGSCFTFTTPDIPNFFTEQFSGDHDLDNTMVTFTPDNGVDQYRGCAEPISSLPVDPAGGNPFAPAHSDDSFRTITLSGGNTVKLYGTAYGSIHVGSNGYLTFTAGDTDYTESLAEHFNRPRVSAMYDDLNPGVGGTMSWKQLADLVAITWQNVPEFGSSNQNTFQIVMYFDGRIQVAYLTNASTDSIGGLSNGGGLPPGFTETDLSGLSDCGAGCDPCDTNCDGSINAFDIQPFVEVLSGSSGCSACAADTNGDGSINAFDIQPFVECLGG